MKDATPAELDISARLSFMDLVPANSQKITRLKATIERELPVALDKFYEKVQATPSVARFFSGPNHMDHAREAQLRHWDSIIAGRFDTGYVNQVQKIGSVHSAIGLEPQWYIGGYAILAEHLVKSIVSENKPNGLFGKKSSIPSDELGDALANLVKAIFLDMEIAVSVYLKDEAEKARKRVMSETVADERKLVTDTFAQALSHLADKDLSYRIESEVPEAYESLKANFNNAIMSLKEAMGEVGDNSDQIRSGSSEIQEAADALAMRTEHQAASVEETAAAMEELTATVKATAERAAEAGELVSNTRESANRSGVVVKKAIDAVSEIEQSSGQINNIIGVIDDIAFQTNLLALNAGVEAARAGDAGKGFAVVAQEVRELAQRSATAAKEIKTLINASGEQVKSGVDLVGETGILLEKMVDDVLKIDENISAIVQTTQEQSTTLQEINTAVNAIDQGTQQNATMVEETTAVSHILSNQAVSLAELLREFGMGSGVPKSATMPSPQMQIKKAPAPTFVDGNAAIDANSWTEF